MEIGEYINFFLHSETPFMLLFVSLFFYYIKSNNIREKRNSEILEGKLERIEEEMKVLIRVWKILLEKELEERK
jgi:hypothetical protein